MKRLALAIALATSAIPLAAQTLTADPYPATVTQPDTAAFTINGGTPIPCTLANVTGGLQPTCDLASIATPGTYTLVMIVTKAAGCAGNECWPEGSASSAPFAYVRRSAGVSAPATLKVAP